ncbi:hypothetical protein O181_058791 [Austropuccinia psidii MF-1]|uniref:SNF2 N-terminal domain-containing protein n=1 Tax=Austropuccinia psidii MF-1 TaxID=1389203 RepID=A0A9Q3EB09_9BASI|nr:hypothetical protein [Austropuccinia psidii MF-1]
MAQSTQHIHILLPNNQNTIESLPGTLSKMLIPFLRAPQTFMHCGAGGAWIENCQSNPPQTLFVEGGFITDPKDPCSSQKHNLALMFFTWYPNILIIIESFQKQDFKLEMPKEYDCNTHKKTATITQWIRPPHDDPANSIIQTPLLPHQKTRLAFIWDREIPNGLSVRNLWATSPPRSIFHARHIITNKVVSSFESLLTNDPLGLLLADDMGLGKTIQAISLLATSKERLITNPQNSTPTIIISPPCLITNWQSEILKNAQAGALQAKIYHGPTCHSL